MKNRMVQWIILVVIILAGIGLFSSITNNPIDFLKQIAVFILIGGLVFYLFRRFTQVKPERKEQQAFIKAARQSKKRHQKKDVSPSKQSSSGFQAHKIKKSLRTKKNTPSHLTVIDGKKGKKKNRASF